MLIKYRNEIKMESQKKTQTSLLVFLIVMEWNKDRII